MTPQRGACVVRQGPSGRQARARGAGRAPQTRSELGCVESRTSRYSRMRIRCAGAARLHRRMSNECSRNSYRSETRRAVPKCENGREVPLVPWVGCGSHFSGVGVGHRLPHCTLSDADVDGRSERTRAGPGCGQRAPTIRHAPWRRSPRPRIGGLRVGIVFAVRACVRAPRAKASPPQRCRRKQ